LSFSSLIYRDEEGCRFSHFFANHVRFTARVTKNFSKKSAVRQLPDRALKLEELIQFQLLSSKLSAHLKATPVPLAFGQLKKKRRSNF
jgi:hypothetical protein